MNWSIIKYGFHLLCLCVILICCVTPAQAAEEQKPDSVTMLDEVIVRPKKVKYSKKNNPAVQLMERIRASKDKTDPRRMPYYSFDKYTKLVLAINDFNPPKDKGFIAKHLGFLLESVDTSDISGKPVLPLSVKEVKSRNLYRKNPHSEKLVVNGMRHEALMESLKQDGMNKFTEDVLREVDIYANDVTIMQNRFVSPLSHIAANYYKFFLDTIATPAGPMLELSFAPHNPQSMGFNGRMYLTPGDTTYFIKRLSMQVPRAINLNYVQNLYIVQEFEQDSLGNRHKSRDDMSVELQLIPGTPGVYGRRLTIYDNFSASQPTQQEMAYFHSSGNEIIEDEALDRSDEYWSEVRRAPVTANEDGIKRLLARLRERKWFYWTEKGVHLLVSGYVPTGKNSRFDISPVNTFISSNTVEGARFRLGGMTTTALSRHFFMRGYGAWGTRDHRWKYGAELEYSFATKKKHSREFPIHSLMLSHSYDLDMLGQHYLFTNADNIFLSLKRKESNKVTYRRISRLDYTLERKSGFSIKAGLKIERQEPSKWLPFEDAYGNIYGHLNQSSFNVQLRYAPGEKFYQTRNNRIPVNLDAPIFILSHEYGPKGFLGSDFCINKTEFSAQKRFWFSTFGYTDILVKAAKVWSQVQYTALPWANANLSYTIQPESFALMNPMEFATDSFISWDLTYWGNGILFNRLPIVKYLRLREVLTFRGLYGHLSRKNNPEFNNELFRFPFESFAKPMHGEPYMEIGVVIDNILTILRLDYVWRLTYRDTPNVDRSGLRVSLHFSF